MKSRWLKPAEGPMVWRKADVQDPAAWTYRLSEEERAALSALVDAKADRTFDQLSDCVSPVLTAFMQEAAGQLENGIGFAVIEGFPVATEPMAKALGDMERAFWILISQIGVPEIQDKAGQRLHHVQAGAPDRNLETNDAVRAYETDIEIGFHGDGSDALAFLCHRQAKAGGMSRLVSVPMAFNDVLARRPDLAAVLQEPFIFDARGQRHDGQKIQTAPIIVWHEGRLSGLYKRGYIELAQRWDDIPRLTPSQIEAMDTFDAALNDPRNVLEFTMAPGQILLANNYAVFHGRTSFEDFPEADKKRHFLRIWLTLHEGRPIPEDYADTREFWHSYRRRCGGGQSLAASDAV